MNLKRILIAEDDPAIATILSRLLEKHYEVEVETDGHGALARASRQPLPDLLLCDVMMPGLDGFGLAQRLKLLPEAKRIPIIFVTARDAPDDVIKGIQAGARGYITKPFRLDAVLAKVQKALGE